jgi:hypothetical protein
MVSETQLDVSLGRKSVEECRWAHVRFGFCVAGVEFARTPSSCW